MLKTLPTMETLPWPGAVAHTGSLCLCSAPCLWCTEPARLLRNNLTSSLCNAALNI